MTSVFFKSQSVEWATPEALFSELNAEFGFTLDACASPENAKVDNYLSWSPLTQPWNGVVWCNPPYGRRLGEWLAKAVEAAGEGATVVILLPANTDTAWWHDYVIAHAAEIRFVRGRLKFGGAIYNAPFPSVIVIFREVLRYKRLFRAMLGGFQAGGGVTCPRK